MSGLTLSVRALIALAAVCVGWRAAAQPAAAATGRRPNVLFILSDDHRADAVGAMGNPHVRTPNLDRLAARGVAFSNAHIMGGLQAAVCAPSRAAILTSRTIFRCPDQPRGEHAIWPATFAAAGYRTFQTGKWHNGPAALNRAFSDSRDTFFGGMGDHSKLRLHDFSADGKYPPARGRIADRYDGEIFADAAVRFIGERKGEARPWFCWVSFTNPHDPRTPPDEYATMYDPAKVPLPANYLPEPPVATGVMDIRDEKLLPVPREAAAVRRELAAYYGSISHLDAQVGRILDGLEASGQAENTIVIFAGDNGLALGSHGLLGKQNVYEHSLGVPLIVAGPGVVRGVRSDAMVYLLDLFPTTCEMAEVAIPATVEGRSFAGVLGGGKGGRAELFGAYTKLGRSVRDERYKLIEWNVGGVRRVQLFDLREDPGELKDLAREAGLAGVRGRLEGRLVEMKRELGDAIGRGPARGRD